MKYYPHSEPVELIFFTRKLFKWILKVNWEVLLLDYTYKINHYQILLCMISDMIDLNTSFYIDFAFVSSEIYNDYL